MSRITIGEGADGQAGEPATSGAPASPGQPSGARSEGPETGLDAGAEAGLPAGKIEVAPRAIATIASQAAAACYGVVGLAARSPRVGIVELLTPERYGRGVEVRFNDDHITIEVYVVLEYGLRVTEVAHNIMSSVKFAVERALGLRVVRVNVNVQALRVDGAVQALHIGG